MNEDQINSIIENEKEWRRFLIQGLEAVKKVQGAHTREIAKLNAWTWVSRAIAASIFGTMFYLMKSKL